MMSIYTFKRCHGHYTLCHIGGSRPGSSGRLVVKRGGLSKRAELQQPSPSPSPAPEEPPYDSEGTASAALLRDVHSALMAGSQKGGLLGSGLPAPAPQRAVLYSVDQPPGPIVWPEDCGVQLLNAPLDGSVDDVARVRLHSQQQYDTRSQLHSLVIHKEIPRSASSVSRVSYPRVLRPQR